MVRNLTLLLVLMFAFPLSTFAQFESQFLFNGQNAEALKIEKEVSFTRPRTVEVPSTCSRQVPVGTREVCSPVTRYRQDCHWVPGSTQCRTEYERVCRPVTRTRQECSSGPSRQVCTERPTRRVCRTNPQGRETCSDVGGGRSCHTVPGERHCRTVTYTDRDCDSVPRQRCHTTSGRNECRDIPYTTTECHNETQYRTETYACTRTETVHDSFAKKVKANIDVQILTNGIVEEIPMKVVLNKKDSEFSSFALDLKLMKEPTAIVVLNRKAVKIVSDSDEEVVVEGSIVLEIMEQAMLPISFPAKVVSAKIEKGTSKMTIVFEGAISSMGAVDFEITHKAFLSSRKTLVAMKADYPSEKIELGQLEDKVALQIDIKDAIKRDLEKKNMLLKLKLSADVSLAGQILNEKKPDTSKLYEGTFVELK